jgi:hypothetical protein
MSFWNSRPSNLKSALTRAGIVYALLACLAFALAIKEGSSTDLFSGAFIFVLVFQAPSGAAVERVRRRGRWTSGMGGFCSSAPVKETGGLVSI